jgi:3-hydroxyacyl-CoA dehydrogenase
MGSSIAALLAGAGIKVYLLDMVPAELTEDEIKAGISKCDRKFKNRLADAGKAIVCDPKQRALYEKSQASLIITGNFKDDLPLLGECDWILEAIIEKLEIKKSLLAEVSKYRRPDCIVSTNTSGISVNRICEDLDAAFKSHFMGTHFFNPPRYMHLFEIIPCRETLPELIDFMRQFAEKELGKGVVLAKDTPNFIGNRIGVFASALTLGLVEKYGYNFSTADELTGPVLGKPKSATFKTADLVGLDVLYHVTNTLLGNPEISESEKRFFALQPYFLELFNLGYLGNKSGQGFYQTVYGPSGKEKLVWDREKKEYVPLSPVKLEAVEQALKSPNKYAAAVYGETRENAFMWEVVKGVLLYSAEHAAEIAADYHSIDNAMCWGYNWEKGPFQIWDEIGLAASLEKMRAEGETIPEWIEQRLARGETNFYPKQDSASPKTLFSSDDARITELGDEVLFLEITTKNSTVTDQLTETLNQALDLTESSYAGLVIGNFAKNFSTGANLVQIAEVIKEKRWDLLEASLKGLQDVNLRMKYLSKPVVGAIFNMTLGGGAEIALHCHKLAAHAETYIGLVEAGVGLIPGGGGTKECLVRATENLVSQTKVDLLAPVRSAWESIAMGKVSTSAFDARANSLLLMANDRVIMNYSLLLPEAKKMVLTMSDEGYKGKVKRELPVLGEFGRGSLVMVIEAMKGGGYISEYDALIAYKLAKILTGGDVPTGAKVSEEYLLGLEREAFLSLAGEERTLQRIEYMLSKGKPLRN